MSNVHRCHQGLQTLRRNVSLLVVLVPSVLLAQGSPTRHHDLSEPLKSFIHESWTNEDGLQQNNIADIAQTPDGYLWLGTQVGVVRFDGISFRVFDIFNTPGMAINWIWSLAVGKDSTLWMGCDHGLVQTLGASGARECSPAGAVTSWYVRWMIVDRSGSVWTAVPGNGTWRWTKGTWETVADRVPIPDASAGYEDADGSIWLGFAGKLARIKDGRFEWYGRAEGMPASKVMELVRDARGRLLMGTRNDGIHVLENGRVHPFPGASALASSQIMAMKTDSSGRTWVGTFQQGLFVIQNGVLFPAFEPSGRPPFQILSIMIDHESNVWFGTDGDGLHLLRPGVARTIVPAERGTSQQIWSVVPRGNDLLLGTFGHGIRFVHGGAVTAPPMSPKLASSTVTTIRADSDGTIWVGSLEGMFQWKNGVTEDVLTVHGKPSPMTYAVFRDRRGVLRAGGTDGMFEVRSGRLAPVDSATGLGKGTVITCFLEDNRGELWVATDGKGIARWNDGHPVFYSTPEGVPVTTVLSMFEDSHGGIWAGTDGAGLARWHDGKWRSVNTTNGIPNNYINAIIADGRGSIWISTNSGIFRAPEEDFIAAAEGTVPVIKGTLLHVRDGLPTPEFSGGLQSVATRTPDGTLWFASQKGAVGIDPRLGIMSNVPPPVHIEHVVADGQVNDAVDGLQIGSGTRSLEFRFVGINYLIPAGTSYKYRLEGFDDGWIDGGRERQATFTNLSPGTYTFRVIAANSAGVWNTTGDSVRVILLPLYWQTGWFIALCAVLTGGAVLGLYRWRVSYLLERERELQVRVEEALAHARVLSGLIPICASCKKIRDDKGYWNQIELYIRDHSDAAFSHSICPECSERLYGDILHRHPPGGG